MTIVYIKKGGDYIFGIPKSNKAQDISFSDIYNNYFKRVYKHVYIMTANNEMSEDIAQESFIKLFNYKEPVEFPGAWLCKTATNIALNIIKGDKIHRTKTEILHSYEIADEINSIFPVEYEVIKKEEITIVRSVLSKLSDEQRLCVMLKYSGYSYDEITQITGISKGNIGQKVARGKANFIKLYEKEVADGMLR